MKRNGKSIISPLLVTIQVSFCLAEISCGVVLKDPGPEWILQRDSIHEEFRPYLDNGYMGVKIAGEGTTWGSDHQHFVVSYKLDTHLLAFVSQFFT